MFSSYMEITIFSTCRHVWISPFIDLYCSAAPQGKRLGGKDCDIEEAKKQSYRLPHLLCGLYKLLMHVTSNFHPDLFATPVITPSHSHFK